MWMGLVFALVAITGLLVVRALSDKQKGSFLDPDEFEGPISNEGSAVPVVFGTVTPPKPNVVWFGDIKTVVVKDKGVVVNYKYYSGLHFILCLGHADRLVRFTIDGTLVFDNSDGSFNNELDPSNGDEEFRILDYEDLFGGDKKDGGFSGILDFETGEPTQLINEYLDRVLETNGFLPAHRGVTGVVGRQLYVGVSPRIPKWEFIVSRINKRFDGLAQWYLAKATIQTTESITILDPVSSFKYRVVEPYQITPGGIYYQDPAYVNFILEGYAENKSYIDTYMLPYLEYWTQDDAFDIYYGPEDHTESIPAIGSGNGAFGYNYVAEYPVNTNYPLERVIYIKKTFTSNGKHALRVTGQFKDKCWISLDSVKMYLTADLGLSYSFTLEAKDIPAGDHTFRIVVINSDFYNEPDESYFSMNIVRESNKSMNPAHIIREVLTDPDWGLNHTESNIDDDWFTAAADTLYDENFGLCILWDRQSSAEDFINEILQHINGQLYTDRTTGKFVLKLIRDDYTPSLLFELDQYAIKSLTNFKKQALSELVNEVVITYRDIDLNLDTTLAFQDSALVQRMGGIVSKSSKYTGVVGAEVANKVARRDLNVLSTSLISCTVVCNKTGEALSVGDVFKISYPDYDIDGLIVRVSGISYGNGRKDDVKIQCTQDVFGLEDDQFYIEGGIGWVEPSSDAKPIIAQSVIEIPYFSLVDTRGQSVVTTLLSTDPLIGFLGVGAGRPSSNTLNADIYADRGSGYLFKQLLDFCPIGILAETISEIDTVFGVYSQLETSGVSAGDILQIDDELMSVVSLVSGTLTVKRGVYDGLVTTHAKDAYVIFWGGYLESVETEYNDGETVDVKLLTRTTTDAFVLADAIETPVEMDARAIRPYLPGQFKINGSYFPDIISGQLVLTWVDRDRLDLSIVSFLDGGVTGEVGVTYEIDIYDSVGTIAKSVTGITANTYTWTDEVGLNQSMRVVLRSRRDGYASYKEYDHTVQRVGYGMHHGVRYGR